MPDRVLSLGLEDGIFVEFDVSTPDSIDANLTSHLCFYDLYDGATRRCTFSIDFVETPEPTMSLSFGVMALASLWRIRRRA